MNLGCFSSRHGCAFRTPNLSNSNDKPRAPLCGFPILDTWGLRFASGWAAVGYLRRPPLLAFQIASRAQLGRCFDIHPRHKALHDLVPH
jgi:hypothetical protein